MASLPTSHVLVLGAGPAGLAAAHELSAHGVKVTIIERNAYVGGLAATFSKAGFKFDLGGHRWFTKSDELNNWFRRLMNGELVLVHRVSRIFHDRQYFSYPIDAKEILAKSDPITIARLGVSYLFTRLKGAISTRHPITMEEAYTAQFGAGLYRMFFKQYSEKVWGLPCNLLSADWVAQRSRGLSIWDILRNALFGPRGDVVSLVDEFMYPRDGYGRICERMAEDITSRGGEILLEATVDAITWHGPNSLSVRASREGIDTLIQANAVVSSIPLGHLATMLRPACDPFVADAARSLRFRDLVTVNLILKRKQVTSDTWLYVQDADVIFGRMHEPKNWSAAMVPDADHTSLVLECFCTRGDEIWSLSDDELERRCIHDLVEKLGFIQSEDVEDALVIRTVGAYPVYDLDYAAKIASIKRFLATFEGLHIVGRGGTFRYNNADHSIEMGLLLGQKILGRDTDHLLVNLEQEYHEEARANSRVDATTRARLAVSPNDDKRDTSLSSSP